MSNFPSLEEFDAGIRHTGIHQKQNSLNVQNETFVLLIIKISESYREWRRQQEADIEKRDQQNQLKKEERIEAAKKAIENFYETYHKKKKEKIRKAREKQEGLLSDRDNNISGTLWERVIKLLNLSDNSSDLEDNNLSKFKELLLSLEKDPHAPGANSN
ncbi:hypothetical protein PCK2_001009 [Pneumocystis canis]|nr:hypothetical protein PCK2_001009 [Pneumocystis canis]